MDLPELPLQIDRERMERALASPGFLMPLGLTPEQKRLLMLEVSRFSRACANAAREDERSLYALQKRALDNPNTAFIAASARGDAGLNIAESFNKRQNPPSP